jgi:hypothetical protein
LAERGRGNAEEQEDDGEYRVPKHIDVSPFSRTLYPWNSKGNDLKNNDLLPGHRAVNEVGVGHL